MWVLLRVDYPATNVELPLEDLLGPAYQRKVVADWATLAIWATLRGCVRPYELLSRFDEATHDRN